MVNKHPGTTNTLLSETAMELTVAEANSRRWIDGVASQLVARTELAVGTGTAWRDVVVGKVAAQHVSEQTAKLDPQRYTFDVFDVTPQMAQVSTSVTAKVRRNLPGSVLMQFGEAPGKAMMELKDIDCLSAMSTSTIRIGGTSTPAEVDLIANAEQRITGGTTDPGMSGNVRAIFRSEAMYYFFKEIGHDPVENNEAIPDGPTAEVLKHGFMLPICNVMSYKDDNILKDGSTNAANGYVFTEDAFILVMGMDMRMDEEWLPRTGGGTTVLTLTDEWACGSRREGLWAATIVGFANMPNN